MIDSPFPRLSEIEDAIQAREGTESAFAHTLVVQSIVMIGILHARLEQGRLTGKILSEVLPELADRLVTLVKISPAFNEKQISTMLEAFQNDLRDRREN